MSAEETVGNEQPEGKSKTTIPEGYVSPDELSESYVSNAAHYATLRKEQKEREKIESELQELREKLEAQAKPKKGEDDDIELKLKEFEQKWEETRRKPLLEKLGAVRQRQLDSEIESALLAAGAPAGILDPKSDNYSPRVKKLLRSSFEYNDDYDYFVAIDENTGKPAYGGNDPQRPYAGVREHVASLKDDPLFAGVFASKTITGSPGYRGGNGKASATSSITRKELLKDKRVYADWMAARRAEGKNPRKAFEELPRE